MNTLYHGDGDTPQHQRWNHDEDTQVEMTKLYHINLFQDI